MDLSSFLSSFVSTYPHSKLIVNINDPIRDYFINVVPILYHIDVINNHKNQFGETAIIDYENDITIHIKDDSVASDTRQNFIFNTSNNFTTVLESNINKNVNTKVDLELPLKFYNFLYQLH